jgi:hypothetical protein
MSEIVYTTRTDDGVQADVVAGWTSDFQRRSYHIRIGGAVFTTRRTLSEALDECQRLVAEWNDYVKEEQG